MNPIFTPPGPIVIGSTITVMGKDVTHTALRENAKKLALERSVSQWHLQTFGESLNGFQIDSWRYGNDILPMELRRGRMYQNLLITTSLAYRSLGLQMPVALTAGLLWDISHAYMQEMLRRDWTAEEVADFGAATKFVPDALRAIQELDELPDLTTYWMTAWINDPTLRFLFKCGAIPLDPERVFDATQFPLDSEGVPIDKDRPEAHAKFRDLAECDPEQYGLLDDNRFVHEAHARDGGIFGIAPVKPDVDPALFSTAKAAYHANGGILHVLPSSYVGYTFVRE